MIDEQKAKKCLTESFSNLYEAERLLIKAAKQSVRYNSLFLYWAHEVSRIEAMIIARAPFEKKDEEEE